MTYEQYVGMTLNQPEIEVRHAYINAMTHHFLAADKVEPIWARAVTDDEYQVEEWLWEVNASRHIGKVRGSM